jgi:hypothetical protein
MGASNPKSNGEKAAFFLAWRTSKTIRAGPEGAVRVVEDEEKDCAAVSGRRENSQNC